jgi:hypothetical protein
MTEQFEASNEAPARVESPPAGAQSEVNDSRDAGTAQYASGSDTSCQYLPSNFQLYDGNQQLTGGAGADASLQNTPAPPTGDAALQNTPAAPPAGDPALQTTPAAPPAGDTQVQTAQYQPGDGDAYVQDASYKPGDNLYKSPMTSDKGTPNIDQPAPDRGTTVFDRMENDAVKYGMGDEQNVIKQLQGKNALEGMVEMEYGMGGQKALDGLADRLSERATDKYGEEAFDHHSDATMKEFNDKSVKFTAGEENPDGSKNIRMEFLQPNSSEIKSFDMRFEKPVLQPWKNENGGTSMGV